MKHTTIPMRHILLCLCLLAAGAVWADEPPSAQSAPVALDLRSTNDSTLPFRGTFRVSPVANEPTEDALLYVDGEAAQGWSVAEPVYDSTGLADGWHDFALQEGDSRVQVRIFILNDERYVFHEGIVEGEETWAADRVHLIHGWLAIPEGAQVAIEDGAKIVNNTTASGYVEGEGMQLPVRQGAAFEMSLTDQWLDGRVKVLEEKVADHEERLNDHEERLDDHDERLEDHEERLAALEQVDEAKILGAESVVSGGTRAYVFLVKLARGRYVATVPEWSVVGDGAAYATVDETGSLTAKYCEAEQEIVLRARYDELAIASGGEETGDEEDVLVVEKTVVIKPAGVEPTQFALKAGWNLLAFPMGRLTEASQALLKERFQPYRYDAIAQTYVQATGWLDNASIRKTVGDFTPAQIRGILAEQYG